MMLRKVKNMIKQGFQGMWRNRGMGAASISSITAVLVILGIVLIMILSINSLVLDTQDKLDVVQIFLEEDLSEEKVENIKKDIKETKGVLSIEFQSKEEALEILKEDWEEDAYLFEGLDEENPLPASYIIQLEDVEYADKLVEELRQVEGIEKVRYHKEAIEKLLILTNYIEKGGLVVISILVLVSIFIISNTIKLTVNSRSREIGIMKYVGATDGYIKGPFLIEGVLFGVLGAFVSFLIVYLGYGYLFEIVNEKLYAFFQVMLVPPTMIFNDIIIIFVAIGAGIGALGSILSMKKFLKV